MGEDHAAEDRAQRVGVLREKEQLDRGDALGAAIASLDAARGAGEAGAAGAAGASAGGSFGIGLRGIRASRIAAWYAKVAITTDACIRSSRCRRSKTSRLVWWVARRVLDVVLDELEAGQPGLVEGHVVGARR